MMVRLDIMILYADFIFSQALTYEDQEDKIKVNTTKTTIYFALIPVCSVIRLNSILRFRLDII